MRRAYFWLRFISIDLMPLLPRLRYPLLVAVFLIITRTAAAQPTKQRDRVSAPNYASYEDHYTETFDLGKWRERALVNTYRTDSTLYKSEHYRYNGRQFVTISRDNGMSGISRMKVLDGPSKELYPDGRVYTIRTYKLGRLEGPFMVYRPDGSLKRRERYKYGKLKQSVCYDSAGVERPCQSFYQPAEFTGNKQEFFDYLTNGLRPALENSGVELVALTLHLNELAQLTNATIRTAPVDDEGVKTALTKLLQQMPPWREDQTNWRTATLDDVPMTSLWSTQIRYQKGRVTVVPQDCNCGR